MFIVSITYKMELSEVDKYVDAHILYLKKHYASGHFVASGRKIPRTGGIILATASSKEELEAILQQDPFHTAGIASYEVTEFIPTMAATDLVAIQSY